MIYIIEKALKTKCKSLLETTSEEEFLLKVKELKLKDFNKPYIFTHIGATDENNNYYLLRNINEKFKIIVSPERIEKLLIK